MGDKTEKLLSTLTLQPVVPVLIVDDAASAVHLARALVAGGLKAIEITMRTDAALEQISAFFMGNEAVENVVSIRGFSFSGQGTNAGLTVVSRGTLTSRLLTYDFATGGGLCAVSAGAPIFFHSTRR